MEAKSHAELSPRKVALLKSASIICMLVAIGCLSFAAGWLWIDTQYLQVGISPNSLLILAAVGVSGIGFHGVLKAIREPKAEEGQSVEAQEKEGSSE